MAATAGSTTGTKIDLGTVVKVAEGSWDVLRRLSHEITDEKIMQYLSFTGSPLSPIYFILIKLPKERPHGKFLFNPNG